ncbi:prepilin-type N-terminal cleavage/methylation domain-containing protein [Demequina globuliformis]|uniref:prepilin-type N-terminal cleavage/methylation domain-containing protein n=1 Tax=Demequina globuliformis TaxID=676202 RepID=UPI00078665A1|nr:prepilin-type N-terminal cleavage/methylation domain-containing protein [Demequina globuliformis]
MRDCIEARVRMRSSEGYSLTELLIAMTIFSTLMALIFSLFITMINQSEDNLARTRSVEQARLGLSQIDRQIRSGNVILDPALDSHAQSGVGSNYSLRVYTQENGEDKCVQWRVIFHNGASQFGDLEYREWDAGNPSSSTTWYNVANNVVAPTNDVIDPDDPESWPPFWLDTTLPTGSKAQNIRVTLRMSDPGAEAGAKPAVVSSVVTGRNTVFGYSPDYCSSIPGL